VLLTAEPSLQPLNLILKKLSLDTEDSMNDHEDTNGSKESFREQDIYLPIANVARIMKNAIPQTGKVM
jgi:hypothetical protein